MALDHLLVDLISTLDLDKVPDKLHCAACHKFLFNAYKPTCCEQSICEPCFTNAQATCPVCDHKPFTEDVCKPSKAMRGTAKAYLKTVEKTKADERARNANGDGTPLAIDATRSEAGTIDEASFQTEDQTATAPENGNDSADTHLDQSEQNLEKVDSKSKRHLSDSTDTMDEEVEIQVEPSHEDGDFTTEMAIRAAAEEEDHFGDIHNEGSANDYNGKQDEPSIGSNDDQFGQMMNSNFNNVDYGQMMQQMMAANGMNGFNPMMGMSMGMNPMSGMFGSFGGPNGSLNNGNSMNMGMNYNSNQGNFGSWNGQNNSMWQNSNANAFSNGMGGDFGSAFGMNMSQNGNFHSQQYSNGDFQNGYYGGRGFGRGRGRGRGGYGRGRGSFNHYSQNQLPSFQNMHESQQNDYRNPQAQMLTNQQNQSKRGVNHTTKEQESHPEDDEFAPGGQDDVQEALGESYDKIKAMEEKISKEVHLEEENSTETTESTAQTKTQEMESITNGMAKTPETSPELKKDERESEAALARKKVIPEAYGEDIETSMPPPSAPLGPSAQYGDQTKDYGFRTRGPGRYPSRGRGSISGQNGHLSSPVKSIPQTLNMSPPQSKGVGVVGAPTGPKSMREPPQQTPVRSSTGGFQIVGRASKNSQSNHSTSIERERSPSPIDDHEYKDRTRSPRRHSRQEQSRNSKHGIDEEADGDRDYLLERYQDRDRDQDRDRRRRKSRRTEPEDYDMDSGDRSYSRSNSLDRKASHRSSRREKEKYSSGSRHHDHHQSSRSRKYHDKEDASSDYDESPKYQTTKGIHEAESWSTMRGHRSSKSSRYTENRNRDDRPADRDRDRNRKRSRHDRDREDGYHDHDYNNDNTQAYASNKTIDVNEEDDQEPRHRSRRHKKDHQHNYDHRHDPTNNNSTPTSAPEPEKDPHTLEREARNRERMLKEQQRREKAANVDKRILGSGSRDAGGGRRVSYKYEDEAERGMVESERATARWR